MNLSDQIPVLYDDTKGWYALSNETFSQAMLMALKERVFKINSDRLLGMNPGPRKDRVRFALERLKREGISIIADPKKGIELFKSNQKMTDKSYFSMGGK
jgi:hypothetical protein